VQRQPASGIHPLPQHHLGASADRASAFRRLRSAGEVMFSEIEPPLKQLGSVVELVGKNGTQQRDRTTLVQYIENFAGLQIPKTRLDKT